MPGVRPKEREKEGKIGVFQLVSRLVQAFADSAHSGGRTSGWLAIQAVIPVASEPEKQGRGDGAWSFGRFPGGRKRELRE